MSTRNQNEIIIMFYVHEKFCWQQQKYTFYLFNSSTSIKFIASKLEIKKKHFNKFMNAKLTKMFNQKQQKLEISKWLTKKKNQNSSRKVAHTVFFMNAYILCCSLIQRGHLLSFFGFFFCKILGTRKHYFQ